MHYFTENSGDRLGCLIESDGCFGRCYGISHINNNRIDIATRFNCG